MSGWAKLFSTIIFSTIWREDNSTRLLWITMLAMANKNGVVEASIPGLADTARVDLESCERALKKLKAPDPYSRSKDFEGRRIEEVPGGWRLLNYEKYRNQISEDRARELSAERMRKMRAKKQADEQPAPPSEIKPTSLEGKAIHDIIVQNWPSYANAAESAAKLVTDPRFKGLDLEATIKAAAATWPPGRSVGERNGVHGFLMAFCANEMERKAKPQVTHGREQFTAAEQAVRRNNEVLERIRKRECQQ